ncbi:hypothetical protein [Salinithrix halophila]|uniref:Zinc-ribbon domain-containing protein n=1 Tax=Salinithrix halophila TaxID=1485204 RepID=A0ABV8JJW1_9BACL
MVKLCLECEWTLSENIDVCPYCGEYLDDEMDGDVQEYQMGDE